MLPSEVGKDETKQEGDDKVFENSRSHKRQSVELILGDFACCRGALGSGVPHLPVMVAHDQDTLAE